MFEDLFDDLVEEENKTQTESCEDVNCDPDDDSNIDPDPGYSSEEENPWEKIWKSVKKVWYTGDEEDKSWDVNGCVFSGSPPVGYKSWSEWIDKNIESKTITGVEICATDKIDRER